MNLETRAAALLLRAIPSHTLLLYPARFGGPGPPLPPRCRDSGGATVIADTLALVVLAGVFGIAARWRTRCSIALQVAVARAGRAADLLADDFLPRIARVAAA